MGPYSDPNQVGAGEAEWILKSNPAAVAELRTRVLAVNPAAPVNAMSDRDVAWGYGRGQIGIGLARELVAGQYKPFSSAQQGFVEQSALMPYIPPLPHPDASNLSLGPNLGGADAVTFPGEKKPQGAGEEDASNPLGGLLLAGGLVLVLLFVFKK